MNLNKKIKAMMFDVDGTLINRACLMSNALYENLKKLKDKGYVLALNTGRPINKSIDVLNSTQDIGDLFDYYFCCNGSEVLSYKENKITYYGRIEAEEMKKLDAFFQDDDSVLAFYKEDKLLINHNVKDEKLKELWVGPRFAKIECIDFNTNTYAPSKCIVLFRPGTIEKVEKIIERIGDVDIKFMRSGLDCVEVVRKGVDKGLSVINFASILNIEPKEILCFGDAENDLPALTTGTGCMVGNKADTVEYCCDDVHHDGICKFLQDNCFI